MGIVKSPYFNAELLALENSSEKEWSYPNHPYSPFFTSEQFNENDYDSNSLQFTDEFWDVKELDSEIDNEFKSEYVQYGDGLELDEFKNEYDNDLYDEFLNFEDEFDEVPSASDFEQNGFGNTMNFREEIFNEAVFENDLFQGSESEFENEADFDDELEFEELYNDELESEKLLEDEIAGTKEPLPIPVDRAVPFATAPPIGSYWPLISSHKKGKVVSFRYLEKPRRYVGNRSRSFLARRSNGKRYHAGIDLYANHKDKVVACEDGVIKKFYHFYRSTYALIVEHKNVVINYGEVHKDSLKANGLKKGDYVRAGQVIGFAGKMFRSSMLHFEIYRKGIDHNLRWLKKDDAPYNLLNPTKYLLFLKEHGKISDGNIKKTQGIQSSSTISNSGSTWNDPIQKGKDIISNTYQKGKLISVAMAAISKGERDENKLTNMVFYYKHPTTKKGVALKRGEPLAKEWIRIRNFLIRPLLKRHKATEGNTTKSGTVGVHSTDLGTENLTSIPNSLGELRIDTSIPELTKSIPSYKFTQEDALWLARFVTGESGVKNDANGHAVIWTMFNRFGMLRHRVKSWSSFQRFLQLYSTTLQPILRSKGAAQRVWKNYKRNPDKYPIVEGIGKYKDTDIKKVQYQKHIDLQNKEWTEIHPIIRSMIINILRGKIPNPGIGIATEFASTRIYFRQKYGRNPKTKEEWQKYTLSYANNRCKRKMKGCTWIGEKANLNQMKNAFFIDNRFSNIPPSAIKIIFND